MNGRATHCFALNGDIFNPECDGLDGVLATYQNALKRTCLYGPTYFNEVINEINDRCTNLEISQYH